MWERGRHSSPGGVQLGGQRRAARLGEREDRTCSRYAIRTRSFGSCGNAARCNKRRIKETKNSIGESIDESKALKQFLLGSSPVRVQGDGCSIPVDSSLAGESSSSRFPLRPNKGR